MLILIGFSQINIAQEVINEDSPPIELKMDRNHNITVHFEERDNNSNTNSTNNPAVNNKESTLSNSSISGSKFNQTPKTSTFNPTSNINNKKKSALPEPMRIKFVPKAQHIEDLSINNTKSKKVYKWKDGSGKTHYTSYSNIPSEFIDSATPISK
ncbi:MAG: hypothetical protein ACR2NW_04605 [Thermodesulfobacteriota bacterium]